MLLQAQSASRAGIDASAAIDARGLVALDDVVGIELESASRAGVNAGTATHTIINVNLNSHVLLQSPKAKPFVRTRNRYNLKSSITGEQSERVPPQKGLCATR